MKIEHLQQLIEISRTHSINQAAANLYISQPSLSLSIRNLEDELGCQLITRTNRGVILTSQGQSFVEYAESILSQFDRLKTIGHPDDHQTPTTLSIANMRFRYITLIAAELYNRHKGNPFKLILHEAGRDGIINHIKNEDAEIGIINIFDCYKKDILKQLKTQGIQYYRLGTDSPAIIVGKGNPLYYEEDLKNVTPEMLEKYTHVRYAEMDYYHYSDKARLVGITKTAGEIIITSRMALYEILEETDAFCVVSYNEPVYKHVAYYSLAKSFRIEGCSLTHEIGWIKREGCVPSALALEFIQLISNYFA